ncbi:hypothetical protein HYQ46_009198 [Verticillium longisporum]|nr:hypothetical protein HYQ46_009198 [Verticillium longisporum]
MTKLGPLHEQALQHPGTGELHIIGCPLITPHIHEALVDCRQKDVPHNHWHKAETGDILLFDDDDSGW